MKKKTIEGNPTENEHKDLVPREIIQNTPFVSYSGRGNDF